MSSMSWTPRISSRKARFMVKGRPPSCTSAEPLMLMSSTCCAKLCVTFSGSQGAPMVTTALTLAMCLAPLSTAAPPNEWPISTSGAKPMRVRCSLASTKSCTLDVKWVFANSPSECPKPVKSKRSTANPSALKRCAMRLAAGMSFEQVKQCANKTQPKAWSLLKPSVGRGRSRRAASI